MIIPFAGRRIDPSEAKIPRFPLNNVPMMKDRVRDFFVSCHPSVVISSGACGADLVALEVAGELNIERVMILPFATTVFRKKSVTDRPGDWGPLFDNVVQEILQKGQLINLDYLEEDEKAYEKTNIEILNKAASYKDEVIALVLWEGQRREGDDASAHFIEEARNRNFKVEEIKTLK